MFEIDPDIRRASSPPASFYTDPALYQRGIERLFAGSWQFAADLDAVRVPGAVYPFVHLEGSIDEPLLLTRDRDDRLHCISNVCTHRGALVCEHPGVESTLRCRYHGRRFALDGAFQHMPEFEQTADFPAPSDDLAPARLGAWGRLLFAAVRPSCSFDEWIGPVRERMAFLPLREFLPEPSRRRDYLVKAHWALYCDNFLEGFHVPYVHSSLAGQLDFSAYRTELFRWGSVQIGIAKGAEHTFDLPSSAADSGQRVAAYWFFLFPNLMLNFYPWGLSINIVRPLAVNRTRVSFLTYVWDSSKIADGVGAELDRVEREDEAVVESVQRGMHGRFYSRGRYSPTREQGTHHFHRLLAERLA